MRYKPQIIPSKRLSPHYYEYERLIEMDESILASKYIVEHGKRIRMEYKDMMDLYEYRHVKLGTNEFIHKSADGNSLRS